ncbi:MAG: oxygenase MpaB family protein [Pseudomonadota bacterium]
MEPVRRAIRGQVLRLMGSGRRTSADLDLSRPPGDDGLFGPHSVAWRVHGDFTTMMIGGVSALLVQMLHPGPLAGVWDHSDFRKDPSGRLRRTAQFIAATTYGSTATAEAMIDRVRGIHDHVGGMLEDGTPYSANDPALLTWVHVAEADSFVRAFIRYREPGFARADEDRYFAEMAVVAERLGAGPIPRSRGEVDAYFAAMRPELRFDHRTREITHALLSRRAPSVAVAPMRRVMLDAGIDLMPSWAKALHGIGAGVATPAVRAGAMGLGMVLRWALSEGSAEARARAG